MPISPTLRQRVLTHLQARQRDLRLQLQRAAPTPGEGPTEVHDLKDTAAEESRGVVDDATLEHALQELGLVSAALRRLGDGSYGTCEACGEAIDEARLAVRPEAALCGGCQRERESHPGPRR